MLKAIVSNKTQAVYTAIGPNLPGTLKALTAAIQEDFRRTGMAVDVCSWNVIDVMVEDFGYNVSIEHVTE